MSVVLSLLQIGFVLHFLSVFCPLSSGIKLGSLGDKLFFQINHRYLRHKFRRLAKRRFFTYSIVFKELTLIVLFSVSGLVAWPSLTGWGCPWLSMNYEQWTIDCSFHILLENNRFTIKIPVFKRKMTMTRLAHDSFFMLIHSTQLSGRRTNRFYNLKHDGYAYCRVGCCFHRCCLGDKTRKKEGEASWGRFPFCSFQLSLNPAATRTGSSCARCLDAELPDRRLREYAHVVNVTHYWPNE